MRSLFWVCAALVVVLGVMSTNLWHGLRGERELAESLRTQIAAAASVESPTAPTLPASGTASQPSAVPVVSDARVAASVQAYRKAQAAAQAPQSELWKDAEYRKARLAQIRISMAASYPELTSELGFSQTEVERVLDLLAEYQMNMDSTLSSLDRTGGRIVVTQEMGDRLQEFSRQRDQALSTALGPARYAQWQQYERDYPARSQVNALNAMLARAGQPMNAAQLKSMTEVLVEAMRQQPQSAETTQRIMTAASRLLSAPQIELVRAQFEQQAALSQAVAGARERAAAAQSTRETP